MRCLGSILYYTLQPQLLSFQMLKELYANNIDIKNIFYSYFIVPSDKYLIHDGFSLSWG